MSSVLMPRSASRARCSGPVQSTSQTSSQRSARPPSTSLIASTTQNGAPTPPHPARAPRAADQRDARSPPGRPRPIRPRTRSAPAPPVERAVRANTPSPKRARMPAERPRSRDRDVARELIRIDDGAPEPASIRATVDLPQPMGPVSADRGQRHAPRIGGHRGACSASVSQASSACASAASTSASSLVTRRSSTKFAWTVGSPRASSSWHLRRPRRVRSSSTSCFRRR